MSAAFELVDEMRAEHVLRLVEPLRVALPLTRGDCIDGPRPCPHSACRYHLASDVKKGHVPSETCCLDVVDRAQDRAAERVRLLEDARERDEAILLGEDVDPIRIPRGPALGAQDGWGGASLQEIGDILGMTRERVRQVEQLALAKLGDNYKSVRALKQKHNPNKAFGSYPAKEV